jgi:2-amino-4-hydroxy-6-hydroxymethyldihydropteridine diphosphokinase
VEKRADEPLDSIRAVIGIGANLGDRLATMREAVRLVDGASGLRLIARSHVYETAPVGVVDQPAFLNAAICVSCTLSPLALLDALLAVERALGRTRSSSDVRWGPRAIDLDVLWIEGVALAGSRLVVPHPRLHERAFALVPMLEIVPAAIDPRSGQPFVLPPDEGVRETALSL